MYTQCTNSSQHLRNLSVCFSNGPHPLIPLGSSYAFLPYIKGISQPPTSLTRLLQKHDIQVVCKPVIRYYNRSFPLLNPDLQPNVVYKISCADCPWSYVGKTGRCFGTRQKEHTRNVKSMQEVPTSLNTLHRSSNHSIDFKSSQVIMTRVLPMFARH